MEDDPSGDEGRVGGRAELRPRGSPLVGGPIPRGRAEEMKPATAAPQQNSRSQNREGASSDDGAPLPTRACEATGCPQETRRRAKGNDSSAPFPGGRAVAIMAQAALPIASPRHRGRLAGDGPLRARFS